MTTNHVSYMRAGLAHLIEDLIVTLRGGDPDLDGEDLPEEPHVDPLDPEAQAEFERVRAALGLG